MKKHLFITFSTLILLVVSLTTRVSASTYTHSTPYNVVTASSGITVALSANPTSMTLPTNATALSWTTTGTPDSCSATSTPFSTWNGSSPSPLGGGPQTVSGLAASNYVFDITCHKFGYADAYSSVVVTVNAAATPSGTLTAGSCTIAQNASSCSATLTWSTSNTTVIPTVDRAYSPFGTIASGTSGSTSPSFTPPGSYPFNLMHNGTVLSSATVVASCALGTTWNGTICQQNAGAISATLSASPTTINLGSSSVLTWSSSGATSCTGTGFATGNATSGTVSVSPASTTTYTVSCTGAAGTAIAQATVTVNAGCGAKCPSVTLVAAPTTITSGSSSTLTWTSNAYVTSCTGTGFNTGGAASGALSVSPTATTTYSVDCTGPFGNASSSATVTVVAKKRPIFKEF